MKTLGLFIAVLAMEVCTVSSDCMEKDFEKLKTNCRRSGLNFDMAEAVQNKTLVCDCLQELFNCVNRTVPDCVDSMKDKYIAFSYTPWDCHLLEHSSTVAEDKCGSDVIFEVRMKDSSDDIDIIKTIDIGESSNSCTICNISTTITLLLLINALFYPFINI